MSLYMETTKIDPEVTVGQIQRLLGRYGASGILFEYEKGEVTGLCFQIELNDHSVPFKLPCRYMAIFDVLCRRRKRLRREDEPALLKQAKRVAWRQILRWVEAQLALVETNMVQLQEVFMPYVLMKDGRTTFYDRIEKEKISMLEYQN